MTDSTQPKNNLPPSLPRQRLFYWRQASIPELRGLSPVARRRAWSDAVRRSYGIPNSLGTLAAATITGVGTWLIIRIIPISHLDWTRFVAVEWTRFVAVAGVVMLVNVVVQIFVTQPRARGWLRANPEIRRRWV